MNIEEYRQMVAEEKAQAENPVEEVVEEVVEEELEEEGYDEPQDQFVEIDGIGAIPVDELAKGYLRQSDYTRKTQELAQAQAEANYARQVLQAIQQNPELAEQFEEHGVELPDRRQTEFEELNNRYNDLLLEREVEDLKSRYEDFDTIQVLKFAYDNRYENLEDAYHLLRSRQGYTAEPQNDVDIESLTEQIRQQVLQDLQSGVDTHTIIQSGGDSAPVRDNTPVLSSQEQKVARNLRMSPEEYAKWRDKR